MQPAADFMRALCIVYASLMHCLCEPYALFMRDLWMDGRSQVMDDPQVRSGTPEVVFHSDVDQEMDEDFDAASAVWPLHLEQNTHKRARLTRSSSTAAAAASSLIRPLSAAELVAREKLPSFAMPELTETQNATVDELWRRVARPRRISDAKWYGRAYDGRDGKRFEWDQELGKEQIISIEDGRKWAVVTAKSMRTMLPGNQIGDEIIDFQLYLLRQSLPAGAGVLIMSNRFYELLMGKNAEVLSRLHRYLSNQQKLDKVEVIKLIIFPIHEPGHWQVVVCNVIACRWEFYCSLHYPIVGMNGNHMQHLAIWLDAELQAGRFTAVSKPSTWPQINMAPHIAHQGATLNCGQHLISIVTAIALGMRPDFGSRDMVYLRRRTTTEMLEQSTLTPCLQDMHSLSPCTLNPNCLQILLITNVVLTRRALGQVC